MKEIIQFLIEIGKLKKQKRRGWELRNVKNPETIADHTFRMAIMAWLLGEEKKLNVCKIIKMSLVHDLCEVYAGDTTPHDKFLSKDKKKWRGILDKWPRLSKKEKETIFLEKYKKENAALEKLIFKLPQKLKREIKHLWIDYEHGLSKEGKFVKQVDRVENLLQALEYCKEKNTFGMGQWWIQIEELVDDPTLLKFLAGLEKKFC